MTQRNTEESRVTRKALIWRMLLAVLLILNLSAMLWVCISTSKTRFSGGRYRLASISDEGMTGVGLSDMRMGEHVWVRWDFVQHGDPVEEHDFYFRGKEVFSIWCKSNLPPVYGVYFREADGGFSWWQNRAGANTFTQRSFYDARGLLVFDEVWFEDAWRRLEWRDGKSGILLDGRWYKLWFDRDGMWTTNKP